MMYITVDNSGLEGDRWTKKTFEDGTTQETQVSHDHCIHQKDNSVNVSFF